MFDYLYPHIQESFTRYSEATNVLLCYCASRNWKAHEKFPGVTGKLATTI